MNVHERCLRWCVDCGIGVVFEAGHLSAWWFRRDQPALSRGLLVMRSTPFFNAQWREKESKYVFRTCIFNISMPLVQAVYDTWFWRYPRSRDKYCGIACGWVRCFRGVLLKNVRGSTRVRPLPTGLLILLWTDWSTVSHWVKWTE